MYIYFDKNGTIKEIVNDKSIRKGSNEANKLYVYLEDAPLIDDIWYLQKNPDGSLTNEVSFIDNVVTKAIPYDAKRDMTYFKDFVQYKFYVFTLTTNYLKESGLVSGTIRIVVDNELWALGELKFNVQTNVINVDNDITQSQYDYLLLAYASRTLNEQTGSDLDHLLDEKIEAKISSLGTPDVFDTTENIEALTSNEGIAVATDTGYIWIWDSEDEEYVNTNYKYLADVSVYYTKTETNALLDTKADKSNTYTIAQVDNLVDGLYVSKMYGNIRMSVSEYNGELVIDNNVKNRYVDPTWYHLQVGDKIVFNGNTNYKYWLAIKDNLSDSTIHTLDGWKQETYVANAEVYVRITLAKTDNSNISIDFAELLGEDVITIHTRKPVTVRIGTVYSNNLNSYLFYSGTDIFDNRLRTSVLKFNKGDIINFKEFGTKYEWYFMAWDFDGTYISSTSWEIGNVYLVQQDCQAVIGFRKSGYDKSLMLKGNIYFKKDLDGTDSATKSVIVLDNTCVKTGETITISNTSNALLYKIDFLSDEWGQGTTSLQTIDYGTSSATVTADMSNVKNVVITMKKTDDSAFSSIASDVLWNIYRQDNITSSLGDKYDVDSIYNVDFEVNGTFEITTFDSSVIQCGHRGWDYLAPENTIPSFELAYRLGFRYIEGDVRWTADGVPVLMHDATINRTARNTDGTTLESTVNIADITYAEALQYDYGIFKGEFYKGTKLPTFDEVMKWCKTRNVYFQIDTTTGDWNETQMMSLFTIVKKYGMLEHVLWESLYASKLRTLYALGVKPKNSKISFYGNITTANVDTAYNLGCKSMSFQYSLATYSLLQYALSKGLKPTVWFDYLDKDAYNIFRLFNLGVVGFANTRITDIYALRWFKTLIGYDDNSQSAVTNKEEELLQQAYSDISDLLSDVSTLEQDNAKLKMEVANLKTAVEGNLYNETDDNGLAYEVALSNPLPYGKMNKIGGMSYKSYQLLDIDNVTITPESVTYTLNSDKSITITNSDTTEHRIGFNLDINKTISISFNANSTNGRFIIATLSISMTFINGLNKIENISYDNNYISFYVGGGQTITISNIMLNEGSTALPYQPYFTGIRDTAVSQLSIKGANLIGGYEQGTYADTSITTRISKNLGSTPKTITIKAFDTNFQFIVQRFIKDTRTYIANVTNWGNSNQTITTNGIDDYVIIVAYMVSTTPITPNTNSQIMGVLGSTAPSEYEPYVTPIIKTIPSEIQALTGYGWGISESVCNYIDYDNKKFVQKDGKYTFTGNETISFLNQGAYPNIFYFELPIPSVAVTSNSLTDANYSLFTDFNTMLTNDVNSYICGSSSGTRLLFKLVGITTTSGALSELTGKTFHYELATPIETDVSQYLTGDDFDVLSNLEPNGSITLDNTYEQEAMYDITTLEKVSV